MMTAFSFKDVLAGMLAVVAGVVGVWMMFNAEGLVVIPDAAAAQAGHSMNMLQGLAGYGAGIGLILVAVGVAYILIGAREDITTIPSQPEVQD